MWHYDKGDRKYKNWIICKTEFSLKGQGKCESVSSLGNGYLYFNGWNPHN